VLLNSNVGSGPHYEASCGLASSACSMWNLSQTTREDWPLALEHDGGLQVSDGSQFCMLAHIYIPYDRKLFQSAKFPTAELFLCYTEIR
jgi:hypothetical protein